LKVYESKRVEIRQFLSEFLFAFQGYGKMYGLLLPGSLQADYRPEKASLEAHSVELFKSLANRLHNKHGGQFSEFHMEIHTNSIKGCTKKQAGCFHILPVSAFPLNQFV
jgi:hypothetical protein